MDIAHGLDERTLYRKKYAEELANGLWGAEVANNFSALDAEEKKDICNYLFEQEIRGGKVLGGILEKWFPGTLYWRIIENGELLVALPQPENDANLGKMSLILDLFAPLNCKIRIFWQKTPCLLDEKEGCLNYCILA